jgi:GNAT superfamily N-acetyltransferase
MRSLVFPWKPVVAERFAKASKVELVGRGVKDVFECWVRQMRLDFMSVAHRIVVAMRRMWSLEKKKSKAIFATNGMALLSPVPILVGRQMNGPVRLDMVMEPAPEDVRLLDDRIYEFNVQATGISDGKYLALFLREDDGTTVGGLFGWTWGETCYVRDLYIPAHLRNKGHGSSLMRTVEAEARARGCGQIVLTTHSFQAPDFYRRLGFEITGRVDGYPRGHQYLTMVKRLTR